MLHRGLGQNLPQSDLPDFHPKYSSTQPLYCTSTVVHSTCFPAKCLLNAAGDIR